MASTTMNPTLLPASAAAAVESSSNDELTAKQEVIVRKFATLLGCDSSTIGTAKNARELTSLLASSVADDAVILTLPSLELLSEDAGSVVGPLPSLGTSGKGTTSVKTRTSSNGEIAQAIQSERPYMAASVLTAAAKDVATGESCAAKNMAKDTSWTKSAVVYASHAVAGNASLFFSNLIDSRVRAWTLLLLRHSLTTNDTESRSRLLGILSASIKVDRAETVFKTLAMPPCDATAQPKEADVILPLLFEVHLYLSIQEKTEIVKLLAPGTISAHFDALSEGLAKVAIRLDTGVLLSSMVDQARLIVFKAVANATQTKLPPGATVAAATEKSQSNLPTNPLKDNSKDYSIAQASNASHLAGFRSALSLSTVPATSQEAPRLQKARTSALRLNSVLLHKGGDTKEVQLGPRRNRSVKWDSPLQLPQLLTAQGADQKKQRMDLNVAKLTSIKSFGRPHGGDFGSGPRNATFGEYGRVQVWGRDGRLAHHPAPMQEGVASMEDQRGLTGMVERNATFDLSKLRASPAGSTASQQSGSMPKPSSSALPRTTTGLENWLLTKSMESTNARFPVGP